MRWKCRLCPCLYTAGAPCCPQCRATVHDEEDEVPKISKTGVATTGSAATVHASEILPDGGVPAVVVPPAGAAPDTTQAGTPAPVQDLPPATDPDQAPEAPATPESPVATDAATPPPSKPATPPPSAPPKKASP